MNVQNALSVGAVPVSDRFIDEYMPQANGDYVKVYLWLLRNAAREVTLSEAAGALMLTEGDVERAVKYWQERGVLTMTGQEEEKPQTDDLRSRYRGAESTRILARLKLDDTFRQLLIIAQTYLSRVMSDAEIQVLAYLYDGLSLPAEVIDYLVAYAVDNAGGDMRYIEKAGADWAANGIRTEEAARNYVKSRQGKRKKKAESVSPRIVSSDRKTDYNKLAMQDLMEKLVD